MADKQQQLLVQEAYAYALTHGLLISTGLDFQMTHAPFTLYPTEIPRSCFSQAMALAPCFNKLVDGMARDLPFLQETLKGVCEADDFMARLMKITTEVYDGSQPTQPWMLGIHRSDYMIEAGTSRLLQVEINTISVAFTALSNAVNRLHAYLLSKSPDPQRADMVQISQSNVQVPMAMRDAVHTWRSSAGRPDGGEPRTGGVVAFVVQPNERNVADQRTLEQTLWSVHGIRSVRITLEEAARDTTLSMENYDLTLPDGSVVALAYYRCGYTPADYYTEDCWKGREKIERANCIKCPSLPYHLCTAKKVQERFSNEAVLQRYVTESELQILKGCMMPQHDLSSSAPAVLESIARAIRDPESHVMKPQREGGGTLVHGATMVQMLSNGLSDADKKEYILMEKIQSVQFENSILRNGAIGASGKTVPELGVFGVFLGKGEGAPQINAGVGHLLRTKMADTQDGGVCSGISALDSPLVRP